MSERIAIRVPDQLAGDLADLVAAGEYESKAAAVRAAVRKLIEHHRRQRVADAIVAGYSRTPQTDEGVAGATSAAIASILEEPW